MTARSDIHAMIESFVQRSPFNRWLHMSVVEASEERVVLTIKWKQDMVSSPEKQSTHGGILATLVDAAGDYAVAAKVGCPIPTVDLHVDFHRTARPGDLRAEGRVIKLGSSLAVAEAKVFNTAEELVASGRGLYSVRPSK